MASGGCKSLSVGLIIRKEMDLIDQQYLELEIKVSMKDLNYTTVNSIQIHKCYKKSVVDGQSIDSNIIWADIESSRIQ